MTQQFLRALRKMETVLIEYKPVCQQYVSELLETLSAIFLYAKNDANGMTIVSEGQKLVAAKLELAAFCVNAAQECIRDEDVGKVLDAMAEAHET